MSCAACSARVEKAVSAVDGVESCAVSLLTNSLSVTGNVEESSVIKAVVDAGYGVSLKEKNNSGNKKIHSQNDGDIHQKQTKKLFGRLVMSVVFLVLLMYISMGHVMWGFYLPKVLSRNPLAIALIQLLLTIAVMIINKDFFTSGFKALKNKSPNMDSLVSLGSMAAFVYSLACTFVMTDEIVSGNISHANHLLHELYYESAAMILALITVGKMLESHSKGKTASALKALMDLAPQKAVVIRDGKEITIDAAYLEVGDVFVVKPGGAIPADGFVIEGECAVDESALTGESVPVDKAVNDKVSAATVNVSGFVKCKTTRVGEDTTLSRIIKLVEDAAATKAPSARIADKVSGIFVPAVIVISIVTLAVWLLLGESVGFSLARAISVLVISCPCALGLATPVAIMVGNGLGAKNGMLFKNSQSLENIGKIKNVIFDKTGTVTTGKMSVSEVVCAAGKQEKELLIIARSAEVKSEHPIAKAIVNYAKDKDVLPFEVTQFKNISGKGVSAEAECGQIVVGNLDFVAQKAKSAADYSGKAKELAQKGKTVLYCALNDEFFGLVAVSDTIKEDAKKSVEELRNLGLDVTMLTGDNEINAKAVAEQAGIKNVVAGVLPGEKSSHVEKLKSKGLCAMVGDGINDAPALSMADVGIAIGAGTDVAIESADVVLVKSRVGDVPRAVRLGRATVRNIHQNLFWAFFYNVIGIPLAAGVLYPAFGLTLNPMFAAAAMSFSSVFVVSNALRLNSFDVSNASRDKKIKHKEKEVKKMQITIRIEGMMCPHCEANVKNTLMEIDGVTGAEVSHEKGTAVVEVTDSAIEQKLKDAVVSKGYKVF